MNHLPLFVNVIMIYITILCAVINTIQYYLTDINQLRLFVIAIITYIIIRAVINSTLSLSCKHNDMQKKYIKIITK